MNPVLTSFIKNTYIDYVALSEKFDVVWISYKSWNREERESQLAHLPTRIYRSGKVLALIQDRRDSRYGVLLPKNDPITLADDSLSIQAQPFGSVQRWVIQALLIRAMPRVLSSHDGAERVEADGLYYVTKFKALPSQGSVITTVTVEPRKCGATNLWKLDIRTVTFTPVKIHEKAEGKLPAKIAKSPRFELDTLSQEVKRSSTGQYVKRPLWTKRKNRVPAVKLGGEITLEAYYQTRLGVLSMFLEDVQLAYGGALTVELMSIIPDEHKTISATDVKKSYSQLHGQMKQHKIWVANHCDDSNAGARLSAALLRLGIESMQTNEIEPDKLNILLVNNKDQYENSDLDPYKIARRNFPGAVIQSCYPERLGNEATTHVVEVLVKELLIKSEVKNRKLVFDYPPLPNDAWFITSIRPTKEDLPPNAYWPMFFCRVDGELLELGPLPQNVLDELQINLTEQQAKQVLTGYDRADLIFWPDTGNSIIAADTGALCLPDEQKVHQWVKEIDQTVSQGIPASLLTKYCDENPQSSLTPELRSLAAIYRATVPVQAFKKIQYKSKMNRHFYDYLTELGYRLKAGFSARKTGAMHATAGTWTHQEQGLYAAGSVGSPSRNMDTFNHIYHVETGGEPIPEWFWKSLEVWHVRHKGATVFPYIFKHLREYGLRQVLAKLNEI